MRTQKEIRPVEIKTLSDTLIPTFVNKVASYSFTIDRDSFLLANKYDLTDIEENLPDIESRIKSFRSIFNRSGQTMNFRGLSTSSIILEDLSNKLSGYLQLLQGYKRSLSDANKKIHSIITDTSLYVEIPDTTLSNEIEEVFQTGFFLAQAQKLKLAKINLIDSRVSIGLFETKGIMSDMLYQNISEKINLFHPEKLPLFSSTKSQYSQSVKQSVKQGIQVSVKVIGIYLSQRLNLVLMAVFVFVITFIWCKICLRLVKKREDASNVLQQVRFLNRNILIGCLFALVTYCPLFFSNPPMALLHGFELIRLGLLTFLIFPFLTKSFKKVWIGFIILWLYYALDDVLLHASLGERWFLFFAGIFSTAIFLFGMWHSKKVFVGIKGSPVTKMLLIFSLLLSLLSVAFNLTGNLNLAKMTGVAAVQVVMLGVTLKVFCTIIVDAIYLQSEGHSESRFYTFLNFERLRTSLIKTLWVLACFVWLVAFVRDLSLYNWFSSVAIGFFNAKRPVGKYHFTFTSVVVFLFIIWLSSVISKAINYFFGYEKSLTTGKKSTLNSMVLIIRLCIWAVGFLIAVAAAGIPLDKVSIMLGALGVGIGFGLQTIVNNLVSGVILAFERPIQIGDQIGVGSQSGIVKEIGVRASTIRNFDGADIIIPNGDLLSQHLTNWTMQNKNRRVEFGFRVPYDIDLEKVKKIVLEKLKTHESILHVPEPTLIILDFEQFAINMKLFFWVPDLNSASSVRSDVMIVVKNILSQNGIELQIAPFANFAQYSPKQGKADEK